MRINDSIRWLWVVSDGFRLRVAGVGVMGIFRVGLSLIFIWICKEIIDSVTGSAEGNLNVLITGMIVCMLLRLCLSLASVRISRKTGTLLTNKLRHNTFEHLMTKRWDGHETVHSGDVLNRIIDDVPTVSDIICNGVPTIMVTGAQLLGALYLLSRMDAHLALVLLFIMPAALLLSKSYIRKTRQLTKEIRSTESRVHGHIQESVQNHLLLRSLEYTPNSISKLSSLQSKLLRKVMGYTDFALFSRMMVQAGFTASYATAFLWGVIGIKNGVVTFGTMTAFLQLAAQIQNPMVELSRQIPAFVRSTTAAERLAELSGSPAEPSETPVLLEGKTGIRIEHLDFAYSENEREIFKDLSHDFAPGSMTAIVGETGIGKTTLMRLMLALISPAKGKIMFYNEKGDEHSATPSTRRNLSYVPQGNSLLSGTIRENLLMGKPDATDKELADALHAAAADFVNGLPEGLDTRCGENGVGLSEGQAQRIAIARGLLRPGGIILLDEPSSSLDAETEKTLLERLREQAKGKTLIIITHREEAAGICSSVLRITDPRPRNQNAWRASRHREESGGETQCSSKARLSGGKTASPHQQV